MSEQNTWQAFSNAASKSPGSDVLSHKLEIRGASRDHVKHHFLGGVFILKIFLNQLHLFNGGH